LTTLKNKHTVPACPTKPWRSREGGLNNRPALHFSDGSCAPRRFPMRSMPTWLAPQRTWTVLCLGLRHQWVGRPREAVLGLPSRNCTPRRGVGSAFRARRLMSFHPGLKHPTSQSGSTELAEVVRLSSRRSPTSRLAFWPHLPQHEGRHSFSDGGLGYSVRPLRGHRIKHSFFSRIVCKDVTLNRLPPLEICLSCFWKSPHEG